MEAFPSPVLLCSLNKANRKKAYKPYFRNRNIPKTKKDFEVSIYESPTSQKP
jgi:hypothetical protein